MTHTSCDTSRPGPDFAVLGAPHCGVRTLESWLDQAPNIALPDADRRGGLAGDVTGHVTPPQAWRELWTSDPACGRLRGDISPWYLYSDIALDHLLAAAPIARMIVCLANPATIAWALHAENVAAGRDPVGDFHAAWTLSYARRNARGLKSPEGARQMDYAGICSLGAQTARLLAHVPQEQVHFVFRDDLEADPQSCHRAVRQFLGAPDAAAPTLAPCEISAAPGPARLHDSLVRLRDWKRRVAPAWRTGLPLGRILNGAGAQPGRLRAVPHTVRETVSDRLADDIATLSVLTGRDLSGWIA